MFLSCLLFFAYTFVLTPFGLHVLEASILELRNARSLLRIKECPDSVNPPSDPRIFMFVKTFISSSEWHMCMVL
jgi:hypothetical protein